MFFSFTQKSKRCTLFFFFFFYKHLCSFKAFYFWYIEADSLCLFPGACISLKDPSLAVAVECCLRSFVKAFCCDNYKDEAVLQELMTRFYPKGNRPQIIVSPFSDKPYNIHGRSALCEIFFSFSYYVFLKLLFFFKHVLFSLCAVSQESISSGVPIGNGHNHSNKPSDYQLSDWYARDRINPYNQSKCLTKTCLWLDIA